jgi:hypothetical protein
MTEDNVKCPVEIKPMVEWVKEPDPRGICRECLLGPVLQWYHEELEARGYSEQAHKLEKLSRQAEELPLQLCEEFDKIKGEVEESLRERLLDFDCAVQSYEPE